MCIVVVCRFAGSAAESMIGQAASGSAAFKLARDPTYAAMRRADWADAKEAVMLTALRCKFSQHPDLRALLLSTGTRPLVEHTANDAYWGDGGDGSGQNRLGALLQHVRRELAPLVAKADEERKSARPDQNTVVPGLIHAASAAAFGHGDSMLGNLAAVHSGSGSYEDAGGTRGTACTTPPPAPRGEDGGDGSS